MSHKITKIAKRSKNITPAERARRDVGLSLADLAKRLRIGPRTLRDFELHGGASLPVARRWAALCGCSGNLIIFRPSYLNQLEQRASRTGSTPGTNASASTPVQSGKRYRPPMPPTLALVPSVTSTREASREVTR